MRVRARRTAWFPMLSLAGILVTRLGFHFTRELPFAAVARLGEQPDALADGHLDPQQGECVDRGSRESDDVDVENLGGFSGIGGIPFAF